MFEDHPQPYPPPWAEAWGDDRYGLWAELLVNGVTQRMRWLAPGNFVMGSPDTEPGHESDEGPQHTVTLTDDLWLADTACTQGLWLAVMGGKNPSRFTGNLDLPVEQVSWNDVQVFFASLHKQGVLPAAAEAVLPTEAQWEYACRAGSTSPFSFGDQISTHQVNYNGNYPYDNSPKGEYRQRTVPVKAISANAWGLYQMHGNVWEWCADYLRTYTAGSVTNPSRDASEVDPFYAVRGGSWFNHAGLARSSSRGFNVADGCFSRIGFRFALRSKSKQGAGGPRPEGTQAAY